MKRFFPLFTALFLMGSMMVVQADTYTVAGSSSVFGSNWSLTDTNNDMTLEDGLYKLVKTDVILGDEVQLKVVKNRSWSTSWPASNYVIPITETAVYTVTVTFNASSGTVTATAEKTGEAGPIVSTYTVAGDNTDVFGTEWDPANTANDMTSVGALYKWEKQVVMSASTIEFKVCKDHGWGNAWPSSNYQVTFPKWGEYILTVTFLPDTKDVAGFYVEKYYTVVGGSAALFGTAWGQDNEDNDMTLQSDGITYKKSYYNVELTAGEIEYKVAADHDWSNPGEYPAGNQVLSIPEDGKYNVTFTYVPSDPSLVAEATLIPEQEIYTVVGSEAALFGTAWETNEPANDMMLQGDGITYVKSYSNVSLNSGDIEYKVAKDHKWGTGEYPTGGLNQTLNIPSNGTYDVTFTYVPSIPSLEAVATLIEPSVDPVQTTITIKGKVPAEWTNAINVYVFGTSDADGFHAATQEGEWWSYTYTGASTSINAIFVNGDDWNGLPAYYQTVDITGISADACYELTYHTGAKATYVGVDCPSTPEPPVVLGVRLNGDFVTPGNPMDTEIFTGDDESVSLKMNLIEGNYEFGVVINDVFTVNGTAFTRLNPEAQVTDGSENMTLDADADGEYTFTWTFATNTLSIDYPAAVTPEYATIKFFAPRDQTNKWNHVYAYATKGNKKDFGPKPGTEITDKDAEWYVVTVRKGSNLLFTDNAGMETTVIENIQDDACYVSTAINYEVTPKIVSLTEQCYVDYYVAGDADIMGSWGAAVAACKFDANNQVIFHDVPAGEYQFKITNGTWAWSIGGNDFLSDEPGCGTIASELGLGNTGFTIDEVQDVTITYYPATRKICLGANTVKATPTISIDDMAIEAGESKKIDFWTNNTENPNLAYIVESGSEFIKLFKGVITGIKAGEATIRISLSETDNYAAASQTFTVTVSTPVAPATAIAPIGGKFIINAKGDTAVFSRGNLQYQQSSDTWIAAPNQYDWKGTANLQMGNAEYEGWVDLFCWSIGAENNYGATSAYLSTAYHNKDFVDWGTKFEGEWATLSSAQWNYLLNSRAGANDKWGMAMIEDNLGMILLPNDWEAPAGVNFVPRTNPTSELWDDGDMIDNTYDHYRVHPENMPANKFTLAEWAQLEAAGAVFLPYAGRRSGGYGNHTNRDDQEVVAEYNYTYYENYLGTYWTSTAGNQDKGEANYVYTFKFQKINNEEDYQWGKAVIWSENGRYGQSVRLVHIIPRQYTVTYTAGEGEGTVPTDEAKYLDGAAITLAAATGLSKDGYRFAGWKFKGQVYTDSYTINNVLANEEIVFEAQWEVDWQTVRTDLTEGWYYTMCLDKAVTAVQGGSIWRVVSKAANASDVILEEVVLPLEAGRPYIFYATAENLEVVYTGAAVGAPVNDAANNGLIGSFSKALIAQSSDNYIIYNNELYFVNSDNVYVGDHRAYLNMDAVPNYSGAASAPGRRRVTMSVHGEQTTTGIDALNAAEAPVKVMIDGNLYILRGEKMYNVNGQVVK